jgi:hypothetical protein
MEIYTVIVQEVKKGWYGKQRVKRSIKLLEGIKVEIDWYAS